jgi:malate dehydrogenase (oxaloacetate-decarboxylating)
VVASKAKRVTDKMMIAAANALGNFQDTKGSNNDDIDNAAAESPLLPPIENMRDVAIHIATSVALQAQQDGVAPEMSEQEVSGQVQKKNFGFQNIASTKSQRGKSSKSED